MTILKWSGSTWEDWYNVGTSERDGTIAPNGTMWSVGISDDFRPMVVRADVPYDIGTISKMTPMALLNPGDPAAPENQGTMCGVAALTDTDVCVGGFMKNVYNGQRRGIFAYTHNGYSWSKVQTGAAGVPPILIHSMCVSQNTYVWACGTTVDFRSSYVYYVPSPWSITTPWVLYVEGLVSPPGVYQQTKLFSLNPYGTQTRLYFCGLGFVYKYDGSAWSDVTPASGHAYYDVWASAEDNVYACGKSTSGNRLLYHWNGSAWTKVIDDASGNFFSVTRRLPMV